MKTLAKVLGIIIVVIIGLLIAIPFFIPVDAIFTKVSEEVEKTTGRTLTIAGDKDLAIFPSLRLELNDVSFSNMADGSRANMATMKQLDVHIPWSSLFSGEVKLDKFVIREPDILLETNAQGKGNWQLFDKVAEQQPEQTKSGQITLPESFDVELGEVAIYGGQFTYLDGQTGAKQQISDLELAVLLESLRKPLELKGGITYMTQRFNLDVVVDNPIKAIEGRPFAVTKSVDSKLVNVEFKGQIAEQGQNISGTLHLDGDSVKDIAKWQGVDLNAKDNAFNAFSVDGAMQLQGQSFTINKLVAKLDELAIEGMSTINLGERLAVNANVDLGMLDLNPYLPEPTETPAEKPADDAKAEPIVWDDTKMDLSALNSLDANVVVRSSGLKARDITLGENQFTLKLQNAVANLSMDKFVAYEGQGKGTVMLNAKQTPYQLNTNFSLAGIDAEPLLTDAAKFDKLMGKGSLDWQLSTRGQSQKDFVNALAGKLSFNFADGAVKGANVAELVRKAKELIKGNTAALADGLNTGYDESQKTDFTALTGSMTFTNGVGTNSDLSLQSPLIRITGEGEVDLPATKVNYRLVTGIVDSIEGQGTTDESTGFKIPMRIKGPFHDVGIKLDVADAAKEEAKEKVKDKVKDKLKGLFGG
ncbi:AsmA family protein [Pseudoalteromonas sp. BDTF-M6]|uniref:AsmA family protein n=1 Tax=Pseudoalteromonas sp. BDTF-M6 TaxID=2796132 RepID=UPI001BAF0243|nr:AsmA family protein [Pseudoalteromonas sp. BDTF-M6]MBS3799260.1 AsmA family protein [Pseudoalteromonas sp. BDTF-M6]